MMDYELLGDAQVKAEFTQAHCDRLHQWYTPDGKLLPDSTANASRERLWVCISLIERGRPEDIALAEAIIRTTPIDHNHFEPIVAVELALRYQQVLAQDVVDYLKEIVRAHLANFLEVRFGSNDTHNFTGMGTFALLAASELLDGYTWDHPLSSIPEVYTSHRLRAAGMNALQSFAYRVEHDSCLTEFNSPTYSPITVHCLAKIVELIEYPPAKAIALELESAVWEELLGMYHRDLSLPAVPYSRAYRIDMIGQVSQMRILMCYLGLSKDTSVVELLSGENDPDQLFHHDDDIPFAWSGPAWQLATRYHVPRELLSAFHNRTYPHTFDADTAWSPFGHIDKVTGKWLSVQGGAIPGGACELHQIQYERWAIGWRTSAGIGHSIPLAMHYALTAEPATMRNVRTVTLAVGLYGSQDEWVMGHRGKQVEAGNLNNTCMVNVWQESLDEYLVNATCFPQMSFTPVGEISLNMLLQTHFMPVDAVMLDGVAFSGEPLQVEGTAATCRVEDHGMIYEVEMRAERPILFRVWKWAKFIRFAAFWYEGEVRTFTPAEIEDIQIHAHIRLIDKP